MEIKELEDFLKIKLPPEWNMVKLEAKFERTALGQPEMWATVVLDESNKTFYVKTQKSVVYEQESEIMEEAISIMRKANKIIKSPRSKK